LEERRVELAAARVEAGAHEGALERPTVPGGETGADQRRRERFEGRDADQSRRRSENEAFGGREADPKPGERPRSNGDRDRVQIGDVDAGPVEAFVDQRDQRLAVLEARVARDL